MSLRAIQVGGRFNQVDQVEGERLDQVQHLALQVGVVAGPISIKKNIQDCRNPQLFQPQTN